MSRKKVASRSEQQFLFDVQADKETKAVKSSSKKNVVERINIEELGLNSIYKNFKPNEWRGNKV